MQKEATPSYCTMFGSYVLSKAEEDKTLPSYSKHDPYIYGGGILYMVVAWLSQWSIYRYWRSPLSSKRLMLKVVGLSPAAVEVCSRCTGWIRLCNTESSIKLSKRCDE